MEYGAWHSRGWEVGAYILLSFVLVQYYSSFYSINSIIFHYECTGINKGSGFIYAARFSFSTLILNTTISVLVP